MFINELKKPEIYKITHFMRNFGIKRSITTLNTCFSKFVVDENGLFSRMSTTNSASLRSLLFPAKFLGKSRETRDPTSYVKLKVSANLYKSLNLSYNYEMVFCIKDAT